MAEKGRVERSIHIEAPPRVVFDFFVDPERLTRWKGIAAEVDARSGGKFRIDISGSDRVIGEYLVFNPGHRLEFTWQWEGGNPILPKGESTVQVEFKSTPSGTLLRLTHTGLPEWAVDAQSQGWDHYLPRLQDAAKEGEDI